MTAETTVQSTPGPWRVEDVAVNGSLAIMAGSATEYRWLATVSEDLESGIDWTQTQANARLVAAAPDLLAAAKQAYEYAPFHRSDCRGVSEYEEGVIFEPTKGCDCFIADLLAVIAKAEGRQP